MDQEHLVSDLVRRAEAAGLSMAKVCQRARVAESTPSRWRAGKSLNFKKYEKLLAVVASEEERLSAGGGYK